MDESFLFLPIQIRFNDIDPWGHVNNAVFQTYFDLGRLQFFDTLFGKSSIQRENGLIIAHSETDFYEPVLLNDSIGVKTRLKKTGNKSITLRQEIIDRDTNMVKACSISVLVCMNYHAGESIQIPAIWRKKLARMHKTDEAEIR